MSARSVRRSRRVRQCSSCLRRNIAAGEQYVRAVVFPSSGIFGKAPVALALCRGCAERSASARG